MNFLLVQFKPMADARRIGLISGEQANARPHVGGVQFAIIANIDGVTQTKIDQGRAGVERRKINLYFGAFPTTDRG